MLGAVLQVLCLLPTLLLDYLDLLTWFMDVPLPGDRWTLDGEPCFLSPPSPAHLGKRQERLVIPSSQGGHKQAQKRFRL